jgi:hypothetical protein
MEPGFLERLKKYRSHSERGFLIIWRGFGEGAGLKNPVTEPKRSQKSKRPLVHFNLPNGYSIYENARAIRERARKGAAQQSARASAGTIC